MKKRYLLLPLVALALAALAPVPVRAAEPGEATEATRQANAAVLQQLPFPDNQDFADAARGRIAPDEAAMIRNAAGQVVWDMNRYKFLNGPGPLETVNPSLRRQATLNNQHGLFQVTENVYQVRGHDLANLGVITGHTGYIVIDPLTSVDTARAAMELVYTHLGRKPVRAVIHSHSHADHWSGVKGVVSAEEVRAGRVRVIAPAGFLEEVVGENVFAGNAMIRRAQYMYGPLLTPGPRGQVDAGLGKSLPRSVVSSLIPPTDSVERTGQTMTIDGVKMVFQLTAGTEAPANMNIHFPELRALFMADNCVAALHNLLTPRGSQVRNARAWSGFIREALERFGETSEVVFVGHTWPRWGQENIARFLRKQADAYKYIHDQTLRLANHGHTPAEIAEAIRLPESLAGEWFNRDYYATVGWNARAVYQHYLGWFDGNPAHFNPLPPVAASRKYVEFLGGAEQTLARAQAAFDRGEYRWVAQVVNHVVFADPGNEAARLLQAAALEQRGYQSESAVFRNFYLFGARELREGVRQPFAKVPPPADVYEALPLDLIFNGMAVRLNGPKAAGRSLTVNWHFTDTDERYVLSLENAVLNHAAGKQVPGADCSVRLTRALFNDILTGKTTFLARVLLGQITYEGSILKLNELMSLLDEFDLGFNVVTPLEK
ncbi:MAG: MBL fold metallo-hydrolase [Deltaproteobacteria bacterium]|nr:MBL fold metallo-hydrolase [Deltaproteobacteria bacterium]